jgi:hypothetical protein
MSRLEAIQVANGYKTDLGLRPIERWPKQYQEEGLPGLGVFDLVTNTVQEYAREKRIMHHLPCQVRIFLRTDEPPDTWDNSLADVSWAISHDPLTGERDQQLGGLAVDMLPEEEGPNVPKETWQVEGAAVGFTVQYLAAPFNAYE